MDTEPLQDRIALSKGLVRLVRDELYVFRRLDREFAVHRPSGEFFALDEVGAFAIRQFVGSEPEEAIRRTAERFGESRADELLADLSELAGSVGEPVGKENEPEAEEIVEVGMTDLTLNLVNRCNLACIYCWNERGSYGETDKLGPPMSPETARKAIDLLVETSGGVDSLVVDFYGGEPLLALPAMKEAVSYCRKISEERGIRFSFLLATNGLLLTPDVATWLSENGVNIAISIDGDKSVQDAQRPLPGGGSSFDVVWRNLENIPDEIKSEYVARATLTPSGPGALQTYEMLRGLGFSRIEVFESEAACFGLPMDHADTFYLRAGDRQKLMTEYEELVRHLLNRVAKGEVEYKDLFFTRIFKQMARLVRNGDFEGACAAGLGQMAVDVEGYVYPCTAFIGQPQWRMGHIDTGLDVPVQKKIAGCDILASDDCTNCWARNLCLGSGSCFNLNHFNHGDIATPVEMHCEMYRFKVELLIAALATLQEMSPERFDRLFAEGNFEDRTAWSPESAG